VVPNGVDTDRFKNLPAGTRTRIRESLGIGNEFVWLAVGRFEIAKDYPNMLRAFAPIHQQYPKAVLLLVGRGSLKEQTAALVEELGLGDRVRFLGVRHDVAEVMSAADGYVMSSAWEGMPMVLLEAAAAGLPIVSTKVGGNHEVVLDQESGYLVPPRDPARLSQAMRQLMELPEERRRAMGERGRGHVQTHYGLHLVAEQWVGLYREILARKGGSPQPELSAESGAPAKLV
jgi:glycosyltransferase involved in cell wall biosynthesis